MRPAIRFETHRSRLLALAHRLLGSRAEAEDVVQEAWLRWQGAAQEEIRDEEAWLITATTRLALDRLRAVRNARTDYVGPWLPEPLQVALAPDPAERAEQAESVSWALMALLERLGPDERAAFLLKEVFDYGYEAIAALLGHSQANCRQLVHRARARLQAGHARFEVPAERHRRLLEKFMAASQSGDQAAIAALLRADARLVSDGGGKVTAALRPLLGAERIARLYWAIARRGAQVEARVGWVDGEPAILRLVDGRLHSLTMLVSDGERISDILTLMNPDKLAAVAVQAGRP
ncbi:RNA polymerase sigma-70 factor [Pseudoxanthomonas winnipegensis]|uniref:RNA polymerase sigma-70 factor n=1 Tax=Pseudoxanthomonas winnipegensis TaxID=2480810 RepID=A0A4Q8M126_9GAMM|nr:RNA polymerase sigma-70 factor [Pseudoxanthomonas winnipegensis]RZZ87015.1 RNA polymerase sigma-70 factor [Pseudoxanthomonas winnipegensis]TAA37769.1 RNA polymerase sigma-70 factor [Pseudoxanthomonas winnipegensis]